MYCIFVTLNGCSQLKRVETEFMQDFSYKLNHIAESFGLSLANGPQHVYTYILPSDHVESVNICLQALQALQAFLKEKEEALYGYSLFISVCENENHIDMGPWRYFVDRDNCAWLVSSLREMFGTRVRLEEKGALQRIKKINLQKGLKPVVRDCIFNNDGLKDVLEAMISRGQGQILHVISPLGYGGFENIQRLFEQSVKKKVHLPLLYLCSQGSYIDEYLPFRRIMIPDVLDAVQQAHAGSQDFMVLRLLKWLSAFDEHNVRTKSDNEHEDLLSFFRLYLPIYRQALADTMPVMIVDGAKRFGNDGSRLLKDVIATAVAENVIVVHLAEKHEGGILQMDEAAIVLNNKSAHEFIVNETALAIPSSRLTDLNPMALLLFYWNYATNGQNYFGEFSLTPVLYWLIKGFDELSSRIVYLISVADGMVPYEWILDATVKEKYWRALIVQRCKVFAELGLVRDLNTRPWLTVKVFGNMLSSALEEQAAELELDLARTILSKEECWKSINQAYLFKLVEKLGLIDEGLEVLQHLLAERLQIRSKDLVNWLNYQYFKQIELGEVATGRLQRLLDTYDFAYRVQHNETENMQELQEHIASIIQFHPRNAEPVAVWLLLYCQIYYTAMGNPSAAPQEIKEVVSLFQRWGDKAGECRSIIEMSYVEFFNKRFRMAFDYCHLSNESSRQVDKPELIVLSLKLACLENFLHGSMHQALQAVSEGIERSIAYGFRRKEAFFRFVHIRICFEYGNYQDALAQLKKLERVSQSYGYLWMRDVINAWRGRCYSYMNQTEEAINRLKILGGAEAQYYLAEAYFISGQLENALSAAQKAMQFFPLSHQVMPQLDNEDWFSGYSLIEGYVEKGYLGFNMQERLTRGFFYYMLGLNGDKEMAFPMLEELCEMDNANTDDLYAYLYLYYYSQLCDEPERKRMAHNRAIRLFTTRSNRCTELKSRKMLENGYFVQKILIDKPVSKFL